jgi:hypothetical protein
LELKNLSCVYLNVAPKLLLMNCNAAVVSSLLLPSVLHGPSTKKNDSSCNNDAISYKNIVAAATGLEKERK